MSASDTRAVYLFDDLMRLGAPEEPIAALRALAQRFWRRYGRGPCPSIVAGDGWRLRGSFFSYCEGRRIVLARNMRNRVMLAHELTHALGFWTHSKGFQNKYAEILSLFGDREVGK